MIIPLEKLMGYNGNKYYFTRAAMKAVDKIANLRQHTGESLNWKVVSNILRLMMDGEVKSHMPSQADDTE